MARDNPEIVEGDDTDVGGTAGTQVPVEDRARKLGWRPKEQFRGDPDMWVDAAEFVRRGEEQIPLLRDNLRKEQARTQALEREVKTFQSQMQVMQAQVQESREVSLRMQSMLEKGEERAYKRAMSELEARMDQAVEEGDVEAAKKARKDLAELSENRIKPEDKPAPKAPQNQGPPPVDPVADSWVKSEDQAWFRENEDAKQYAIGLSAKLMRDPKTKDLTLEQNLKKVREMAAEKFPEYFDPNDPIFDQQAEDDPEPEVRKPPARVAAPRSPSSGRRQTPVDDAQKRFEDIPAEDQKQFHRIARELKEAGTKKPYTKEQYAEAYWMGGSPKQSSRV